MSRLTKIKTRSKDDGSTEILVLVNHPMETGQRTDPVTKKKIPAHFIQTLTIAVNNKPVAVTDMNTAVSKDPLIAVEVKGAKTGDKVTVNWQDNKGETGSAETTV